MNLIAAQELLLQAPRYFEKHTEGYQTWGTVVFKQIAIRVDRNKILISHPSLSLSVQTIEDYKLIPIRGSIYFQKNFFGNAISRSFLLRIKNLPPKSRKPSPLYWTIRPNYWG